MCRSLGLAGAAWVVCGRDAPNNHFQGTERLLRGRCRALCRRVGAVSPVAHLVFEPLRLQLDAKDADGWSEGSVGSAEMRAAALDFATGALRMHDAATDSWDERYFLLRPAYLEYHVVGQLLHDDPPCMPLAFAWVGARLHQPTHDHVVFTLQFREAPNAPFEEWRLAAPSRNEARQWVDALETLGVRRSQTLGLRLVASAPAAHCRCRGDVTRETHGRT